MHKTMAFSVATLSLACTGSVKETDCPWGYDEHGCASCFVAGTRIRTPDGERVIEQLREGDSVLSWSIDQGKVVIRQIQSLLRATATQVLRIWVGGRCIDGVTEEHPVYCPATGAWKPAGTLLEGDAVLVEEAGEATVRRIGRIERCALDAAVPVYNLSVEGPEHNYFAEGVLVHNKTPDDPLYTDCGSCSGTCDVLGESELQLLSMCSAFDGDVNIRTQLTALNGLSQLERVSGNLRITDNPALTSLSDLSGLREVAGELEVSQNDSLAMLEGLSNLEEVGDLTVADNPSLSTVQGLEGLIHVYSYLQLDHNPALTTLAALESLAGVGASLTITWNLSLCQTEVDAFAARFDLVDTELCCNDETC